MVVGLDVVVLMEVGRTGALGLVEVEVAVVDVEESVVMVVVEREEEEEGVVVVVSLVLVLADMGSVAVTVATTVVRDPPTVEVRVLVCVTTFTVAVELCTPMDIEFSRHVAPVLLLRFF